MPEVGKPLVVLVLGEQDCFWLSLLSQDLGRGRQGRELLWYNHIKKKKKREKKELARGHGRPHRR